MDLLLVAEPLPCLSYLMGITDAISIATLIALILSFISASRSNRRLSDSMRLDNLQSMVGEMNQIRRTRAENPDLERALFDKRNTWDDERINTNLMAVQLANIFEWAYFARRDGLIESDVWVSWVETWRSVILDSTPMRTLFTDQVWTFGRHPDVAQALTSIIQSEGEILDPLRKGSRFLKFITGI